MYVILSRFSNLSYAKKTMSDAKNQKLENVFVVVLNIFSRLLGNIGGIIANIIGAGQFGPLV